MLSSDSLLDSDSAAVPILPLLTARPGSATVLLCSLSCTANEHALPASASALADADADAAVAGIAAWGSKVAASGSEP